MKPRFKILMILVFMLFFMVNIKVTSHEEIYAVRLLQGEKIKHIEVITPQSVNKITLDALDKEGRITHFFTLKDYAQKKNSSGNSNNIFYITEKAGNLNNIHKLILYWDNNKKKTLEIEEMDSVSLPEDVTQNLSGGETMNFKVMTYNIHHGKNLLGRNTLDKVADIIHESKADVIGLQEVDSGVIRTGFKDQIHYLSEKLSMYYAYGPNINLLGGKYGNAVLSKYPIESYENIQLPSRREQRGLLSTKINVDGKRIYFLTTHLGLNDEERMNQVNTISKYLETLPREVILAGDFNALYDSPEIHEITKRLTDVGYAAGNNTVPTYEVLFLSARIDYIFSSSLFKINGYDVIKSKASDHYPVIADLKLE
jgi:endonuclease/exonuclease/phosphatase family metal-dependent hydrolase